MGRGEHQAGMGSSKLDFTPQERSRSALHWDEEDGAAVKKPGLCCLQGCLAGTAVGVSFFAALPTGIILIVLSSNKSDQALLSVGCVLVVLPVIVLAVVIVLCINQNKLCGQCNQTGRRKRKTAHADPSNGHIHTTASSGQSPV